MRKLSLAAISACQPHVFIAVAIAIIVTPRSGSATAVVAPHALFLDQDSPSAVLYVHNTGDRPQELSVQLTYGYPVSDKNGDMRIKLQESPGPAEPSAAGWVRALPRRALLQPGERQAVRFLARPPADLPNGEYWSRVLVMTREAQPSFPIATNSAVRAAVTLETRTITSLSYRNGNVSTGVRIRSFSAEADSQQMTVHVRLERVGNSAYIGRLRIDVANEAGQTVASWHRAVAVYRTLYRRAPIPTDELSPGTYTVTLRLDTDRTDIPPEDILQFGPVTRDVTVRVP